MTPSHSKLLIPSALLLLGLPACSSGGGSGGGSNTNNNVTVGFDLPSSSAVEGAGQLVVTLSLSEAAAVDVSVPFTLGGSATENFDYTTPMVSPLVITAGDLVAQITFALIDDGECEADESIEVTLGAPTDADLGAQSMHMATIEDDDGTFIEIEPNNGVIDSNNNGTVATLSPGISCEILGTIEFNVVTEFDVFQHEVSETTLISVEVVPSSGTADLQLLVVAADGTPLTAFVNDGAAGASESVTLLIDPTDPNPPLQSPFHVVIVSLANNTNYTITVSGAQPVVGQDTGASAPSIVSTRRDVTFEGEAPRVAISHELK